MIKGILENYRKLVDNRINELFPESDVKYNEVIKAARYSLLSGGKRLRPFILSAVHAE